LPSVEPKTRCLVEDVKGCNGMKIILEMNIASYRTRAINLMRHATSDR
jgi:hypothetical protein